MPVEIRELQIKAAVGDAQPAANRTSGPSTGGGGGEQEREDLIAECVERVMYILKQRKER